MDSVNKLLLIYNCCRDVIDPIDLGKASDNWFESASNDINFDNDPIEGSTTILMRKNVDAINS